jgi:uncharacterized protein (DUF736 family)
MCLIGDMQLPRFLAGLAFCSAVLSQVAPSSSAQTILWQLGKDDNGWPAGTGGADASFVQENAVINPLPGSPVSTTAPQGADNDYYFAGTYTTVIAGNGVYDPVGVVDVDEEAAERAFAGGDKDWRVHFNLPANLKPTNLLSVTFDLLNLDTSAANTDPRYGIEVYVNGVLVQPEILVRAAQLNKPFTTPQFTLAKVNAAVGAGPDNVVSLRGIDYNSDGGGNWMGFDYAQLNLETALVPAPTFPWAVGKDDGGWPVGNGGGTNATFVQENGTINPLPGVPNSPETDKLADNDYYFGGSYTQVIAANGTYTPVGTVSANEEAAERAFAGADNELRYHFNLPNSLKPTDQLAVTFEPLNLDDTAGLSDPRYGVEVWVNSVRVQPEIVVRKAQLNKAITTPSFTLASVGAQVGAGWDNIVTLKGINHGNEGGGQWMGIDYVQLNPVAAPIPQPTLPIQIGKDDNAWPAGNGGGANASFVQENGVVNPLPGNPNNPEIDQQADNDYYMAGIYSTIITNNGNYTPVGKVQVNEEAAERAFAGANNELRYHFNLPATLSPTNQLSVSFDALNLDTDNGADPRWGIEVYFNNVLVQTQIVIRPTELNKTFSTPAFTLAQVKAGVGQGFDNILKLKGISYNNEGGGNWMGIDYVQVNPVVPPPFPWSVGKNDNGWPAGNGGGPNASFVQEAGVNVLPGNPASPEVDAQADDDYYLAGEYTKPIPSVVAVEGDYTPVGLVLVNEEAAERAFAGSDNTKRYHFNLPATLSPTNQLVVSLDMVNLDTGGGDPHYGVEVYVNDVLVLPEVVIFPADLNRLLITPPFTLKSVNAEVGPGWDNIVTLKGINKSGEGGGQWMGIDYVNLDPVPVPVFPLQVGKDDNDWPVGDGGGPNATFVQEAGVNDLPGRPNNLEVNQQADDDYYFAGNYTTVIDSNGAYEPVGMVTRNEEAAERAFAGSDNDKRYHFNLPATLKPTDKLQVTWDPLNLDLSVGNTDPQYGVEVYFNSVLVQPEIIVRTNGLDKDYVTAAFTLASVNAKVGPGFDNIVTLKGINHSAEGGGQWMGIDYVLISQFGAEPPKFKTTLFSAGKVTIDWTGTGTLESATAVTGPWTPVTNPTQPYVVDVSTGKLRFFRLRAP